MKFIRVFLAIFFALAAAPPAHAQTVGRSAWTDVYQSAVPTTGNTVTLTRPSGPALVHINLSLAPAASLDSLTVALSGAWQNGDELFINSSQFIRALTMSGSTFAGVPSSIATSSGFTLVYISSSSSWNPKNVVPGQTGLDNLFAYPLGSTAPVVAPCKGSGDEQAFTNAQASARSRKVPFIVPPGCGINNQIIPASDGLVSMMSFGGQASDFNTMSGANYNTVLVQTQNEAQTAADQTAYEMNAPRQWTMNGVNFIGTGVDWPMALFNNKSQNGHCCAANAFVMDKVSVGSVSSVLGCALDADLNCVKDGGVQTLMLTSGGSGYVDGTYFKVPLTGGSGTTAFANRIVVSGGVATSVIIPTTSSVDSAYMGWPGQNYVVNDVLSASNANLGGTGSGLQLTVTDTIDAQSTAANVLPRITATQFAGDNSVLTTNTSDVLNFGNQFSSCVGVCIRPIFGGGGNMHLFGRYEFHNNGILLGDQGSSTGQGESIVGFNTMDHMQAYPNMSSYSQEHREIKLGAGNGYLAIGNMIYRTTTSDAPILIGGGPTQTKNVMAIGNIFPNAGGEVPSYCHEVRNATNASLTDYVGITGTICNNGVSIAPVLWTAIPAHALEDSQGPGGQHAERGRPFCVGCTTMAAKAQFSVDLTQADNVSKPIGLPQGTTGQRPTCDSTTVGGYRYNTTTGLVEACIGPDFTWAAMAPVNQTPHNAGTCTTTLTVSLANGINQYSQLAGNCTVTPPTFVAGGQWSVAINTSASAFTWAITGVNWSNGVTPTASGASKTDHIGCISNFAQTGWDCSVQPAF